MKNDELDAEVKRVAEQNNVLPEEVQVVDLGQKQVHVWEHRGLRHTCVAGTHPRHFFISKASA